MAVSLWNRTDLLCLVAQASSRAMTILPRDRASYRKENLEISAGCDIPSNILEHALRYTPYNVPRHIIADTCHPVLQHPSNTSERTGNGGKPRPPLHTDYLILHHIFSSRDKRCGSESRGGRKPLRRLSRLSASERRGKQPDSIEKTKTSRRSHRLSLPHT